MNMQEGERTVYFIDLISENDNHMVFNASMVKIWMGIMPQWQFRVFGILSSIQSYGRLITPAEKQKIIFQDIPNPKVEGRSKFLKLLNYLRKEWIRIRLFRNVLKNAGENDLVFLAITSFTILPFFKFLKRYYNAKVVTVLHGDVDYIYIPSSRLEKLIGWFYKRTFKSETPGFKYLLLNKISKPILIKDEYLNAGEVFEINHPFTFLHHDLQLRNLNDSNPVRIGHIGSMEVRRKGSHLIYDLAKRFKDKVEGGIIEFKVIGIINEGFEGYKNPWVKEIIGNESSDKPKYLDRTTYENELAQLDFCVFFYPQEQYVFRASGAVADFISFQVPIITLKHPYFQYIFEEAGNVGYMCENIQEMEELIKRIVLKDAEILKQYDIQKQNLELLKEKFSIETIARDLKEQTASYLNL